MTTPVAPSWLNVSVGRALHWHRRGHGFKSHLSLNCFQVFSVCNCNCMCVKINVNAANLQTMGTQYNYSDYYSTVHVPYNHIKNLFLFGRTAFKDCHKILKDNSNYFLILRNFCVPYMRYGCKNVKYHIL